MYLSMNMYISFLVLKEVSFTFFFYNYLICIMSTLISLPSELLQEILDYIDSVKQLVECRLANKTFGDIAECIILKKKITIKSTRKAIQLCENLKKKLSRGSQITHLDISVRFYFENPDFIQLLRLAFTPSMEPLSGLPESYDLFDNLYAISNSSLAKFDKLKVIPSLKSSSISLMEMHCLLLEKHWKMYA